MKDLSRLISVEKQWALASRESMRGSFPYQLYTTTGKVLLYATKADAVADIESEDEVPVRVLVHIFVEAES